MRVGVALEPGWSSKRSASAIPMGRTHIRQRGAPGVGAGSRERRLGGPARGGVVPFALVTSRPWARALPGIPEVKRQPVDSSSALSDDPGATVPLLDLAVTELLGVQERQGSRLGAAGSANADGMPRCAVDLEELARWAGLQRCSFAPGRLFERDARGRGQRRQGLEQRCRTPGPRGLSCNYCSRAYSPKRCKPVRARLPGQCDVSQQGGDVGTHLAHQGNSSGRSDGCVSVVPEKYSAVASTRLSLTERACRMAATAYPARSSALDRDPVVASFCSRGHCAGGRQMRIEDRALKVSVPDSGPRLRLGQRPDGGLGRS